MQGRAQFYIQVTDDDSNENDHVDDIYVDISRTPSAFFSSEMSYNGDHGNGRITLSFRVQCNTFFFLDNCTRFCRPTDDSTGHFTCGSNGELLCLEGWQDTSMNCLTRISDTNCVHASLNNSII